MQKRNNLLGNKLVTFSMLILVAFGSLMIASAEMGNSVGDTDYLTGVITRQVIYAVFGIIGYFFLMHAKVYKWKFFFIKLGYFVLLGALIACRAFSPANGAYAWLRFGSFTIQPSEFAKTYIIVLGARLFANDHKELNTKYYWQFVGCCSIYFVIILLIQNDLGSSVVLAIISYLILIVPPYKELKIYQKRMIYLMLGAIAILFFMMSGFVTKLLMNFSDDYRVARFLAAANPFMYRYDNGYHIIMSLVSFANGNIFGLGLGNSIHKYMNFPNPSNDFILPIIVEEFGIVGFVGFVAAYLMILLPFVYASLKTDRISSKIVYLGLFTYFMVHFILNVGGVSAIIPLTGVPLLIMSSGGSSLVSSLACLGIAQGELLRNKESSNESNSREIQKNSN